MYTVKLSDGGRIIRVDSVKRTNWGMKRTGWSGEREAAGGGSSGQSGETVKTIDRDSGKIVRSKGNGTRRKEKGAERAATPPIPSSPALPDRQAMNATQEAFSGDLVHGSTGTAAG